MVIVETSKVKNKNVSMKELCTYLEYFRMLFNAFHMIYIHYIVFTLHRHVIPGKIQWTRGKINGDHAKMDRKYSKNKMYGLHSKSLSIVYHITKSLHLVIYFENALFVGVIYSIPYNLT